MPESEYYADKLIESLEDINRALRILRNDRERWLKEADNYPPASAWTLAAASVANSMDEAIQALEGKTCRENLSRSPLTVSNTR